MSSGEYHDSMRVDGSTIQKKSGGKHDSNMECFIPTTEFPRFLQVDKLNQITVCRRYSHTSIGHVPAHFKETRHIVAMKAI